MKDFWLIKYGKYGIGWDADIQGAFSIFYGTYFEACRECIKNDESTIKGEKRYYRKVEKFELPDVSRKKKSFYVL